MGSQGKPLWDGDISTEPEEGKAQQAKAQGIKESKRTGTPESRARGKGGATHARNPQDLRGELAQCKTGQGPEERFPKRRKMKMRNGTSIFLHEPCLPSRPRNGGSAGAAGAQLLEHGH